MNSPLIEMKDICKSFSGVKVLKNVQFSLDTGEVHALVGENGAGKSTLMKILGGIYGKDQGNVLINGQTHEIASPRIARDVGIAIIHQELNLIPDLTVAENMFLGREHTFGRTGLIRWQAMMDEAKKYLTQLGLTMDSQTLVGHLSVGQQQMVEIAKALSMQANILVMDEPTAALTHREIESLFDVISSLKKKGVGMVYISHRMEEIFRISDRITVLRDGNYIGTKQTAETNLSELVHMMVGREINDRFPKITAALGPERLKVENINQKGTLYNINFAVRAGEILGISGLMGAGRTDLAKVIFGANKPDSGRIMLDGRETAIRKPIDAIRAGIGFVTEDRKNEGLVLSLSVRENLALPNLNSLSFLHFVNKSKEEHLAAKTIEQLSIKTNTAEQNVGSLSGGNQQKVVVGKWLAAEPRILILDEPTRGIDIGAKEEVYDLMNQLSAQGVAIIMISSDLPEILGMSDRILVMHEGRITGEFERAEATQEAIMHAATGGGKNNAS